MRRIEAICTTHGTSLRRAALQFALLHPAVVSVVLGAVRPTEIGGRGISVGESAASDGA